MRRVRVVKRRYDGSLRDEYETDLCSESDEMIFGVCQGGCRVSVFHVHADSRSFSRRFERRVTGLSITFPIGAQALTPPVHRFGFCSRTSS